VSDAGGHGGLDPDAAPEEFIDALRRHQLLTSNQLADLVAGRSNSNETARGLASELVRCGWLTPFQVNQLFLGKGNSLCLGRYVLRERLGEGGAGQVLKAWDQTMERMVALKVIRPELLREADVVQRFYREMQVVGRLSHPNIVHALDAGPIGPTHVLVMEYVDGIDLGQLVRQCGPRTPAQALDYIRQAAHALQYVHEQGMVHRDVKPSNLLVRAADGGTTQSGNHNPCETVKLLDLGLARYQRTVSGEQTNFLTPQGAVMIGTPDFLAPEQAIDFHRADIRADIYGLGCTLYYLLTAQPPFPGGSLAEKLARHQSAPPPALPERPELPRALPLVLAKMLAKRPEDRFQTPLDVVRAVTALLETHNTSALDELLSFTEGSSEPATVRLRSPARPSVEGTPPRLSGRGISRRLLLGLFAGALSVGGTITFFWLRSSRRVLEEPPHEPPIVPRDDLARWHAPGLEQVLGDYRSSPWGLVRAIAFDPKGNRLCTGGDDGIVRVWDLAAPTTPIIPQALDDHESPLLAVAWSPDGKWLLSGSRGGNLKLRRCDSKEVWSAAAAHPGGVHAVVFAPDGQSFATAGQDGTVKRWIIPTGSPQTALLPVEARAVSTQALHALVFAKGETLVAAGEDGRVRLGKPRARTWVELPDQSDAFPVADLARNRDGTRLIAGGPSSRKLINLYRMRVWDLSEAPRVIEKFAVTRVIEALALHPDGNLVAGASHGGVLFRRIGAGATTENSDARGGRSSAIAFSPSGAFVAVGYPSGASRVNPLVADKLIRSHRGEILLQGGAVPAVAVAFAPDGRTLISVQGDVMLAGEKAPASVHIWDWRRGERAQEHLVIKEGCKLAALAPDRSHLAVASKEAVKVWALHPAPLLLTTIPLPGVTALQFFPNSRELVASNDTEVVRWQVGSERPTKPLRRERVTALASGPAGTSLALGYQDGSVGLGDETGKRGERLGPPVRVSSLTYLGSATLLSGHDDGSLTLWDAASLRPKPVQPKASGTEGAIISITVSPNGDRVAISDNLGNLVMWDASMDRRRHAWKFPGPVRHTAFSPAGAYLATANANGTIFILKLE
jgi:serine/threonine-protein kinase